MNIKGILNQIFNIFWPFLRYNNLCTKFYLFGKFWSIETLCERIFFENVLTGPFQPLCIVNSIFQSFWFPQAASFYLKWNTSCFAMCIFFYLVICSNLTEGTNAVWVSNSSSRTLFYTPLGYNVCQFSKWFPTRLLVRSTLSTMWWNIFWSSILKVHIFWEGPKL